MNAYHSDHVLRTKLPLFYFGDLCLEDRDRFQSLLSPVQFETNTKNDTNNNNLLTPEALLLNKSVDGQESNLIKDIDEQKHVIKAYRQLNYKMRFLGKFHFYFFFASIYPFFHRSIRL